MSLSIRQLALNTASLGHNLEGYGAGLSPFEVIDLCAEKGLGGVSFWRREISKPAKIARHAADMGVKIIGLCRTPYLIGADADLGDLSRSIETAAALGAPVLTIVTGGVEPQTRGISPSLDMLRKRLEKAVTLAEAAQITLAIEPLHPIYAGNRGALCRTEDAVEIVCEFDREALKIAIDVYHVWWDLGLAKALARAQGRIAGFHLCDWLENTEDILLDRGMMGEGVADIRAIRKLVENTGYMGLHEVEIFSAKNWWRRPPEAVIDAMIESYLTFC